MSIKQVSVFIENRPGALEEFCTTIGEAGIDLIALSIADTTDFGILRAIVDDTETALALIQQKGYTAKATEVLAVAVPDTPGGLASALTALREGGVSIEYLYSFVRRLNHQAIIIFKVNKPEAAERILTEKGLKLVQQSEVACAKSPDCAL